MLELLIVECAAIGLEVSRLKTKKPTCANIDSRWYETTVDTNSQENKFMFQGKPDVHLKNSLLPQHSGIQSDIGIPIFVLNLTDSTATYLNGGKKTWR